MKTVELTPAYVFTCEECGRDTFVLAVVHEFSDDEAYEMREEHGIEVWEEGNWMTVPAEVWCEHCYTSFKTQHFRDESEDDNANDPR